MCNLAPPLVLVARVLFYSPEVGLIMALVRMLARLPVPSIGEDGLIRLRLGLALATFLSS